MNLREVVWPNPTPRAFNPLRRICLIILSACSVFAATTSDPKPPGKLVDLGGHRLHVNCTGKGSPAVVVENGLGIFSGLVSGASPGFWLHAHLYL
jgi:hypothetical protein